MNVNLKTITIFLLSFLLFGCEQKEPDVVVPGLNNLYMISDAQTRSISPENLTGEKGGGGKIKPEDGNAKRAATKYGWKTNPYIFVQPGETKVLAEAEERVKED